MVCPIYLALYSLPCLMCCLHVRMHLLETMPSSLPKLLNAVKWSQHKDVSVVCAYIHTAVWFKEATFPCKYDAEIKIQHKLAIRILGLLFNVYV